MIANPITIVGLFFVINSYFFTHFFQIFLMTFFYIFAPYTQCCWFIETTKVFTIVKKGHHFFEKGHIWPAGHRLATPESTHYNSSTAVYSSPGMYTFACLYTCKVYNVHDTIDSVQCHYRCDADYICSCANIWNSCFAALQLYLSLVQSFSLCLSFSLFLPLTLFFVVFSLTRYFEVFLILFSREVFLRHFIVALRHIICRKVYDILHYSDKALLNNTPIYLS